MSFQILDRIRLHENREEVAHLASLTEFRLYVSASLVDPLKSGKVISIQQFLCIVKKNEKINSFIDRFKLNHSLAQFNLLLMYNHQLYNGDLTFGEVGIKNNSQIELWSPLSEKEATANEGFVFTFWSLVPLMMAASFLIGGLGGRFDVVIRGVYVMVGTIIFIPSFVLFIIGISQKFTKTTQVAFVNHEWFGDCCECCCKSVDNNDDDDDEILLIEQHDSSII